MNRECLRLTRKTLASQVEQLSATHLHHKSFIYARAAVGSTMSRQDAVGMLQVCCCCHV